MGTITVRAPAGDGYEGYGPGGAVFRDGVAEIEDDNEGAIRYYKRHGYGVGGSPDVAPAPAVPDSREIAAQQHIGTPLRDAAVDPEPEDFMPPVNAGRADPHGPDMVAPGLHAVPPGPIVPGPVPSDPDAIQARESDAAAAVLVEQQSAGEVMAVLAENADAENAAAQEEADADRADVEQAEAPAESARKAVWVDYAVSQGADRPSAEAMTKDKLVEQYGGGR